MSKKIFCVILILIFFLTGCLTVQAATATASLKTSNLTVKSGENFSVTLSVSCADGINGIAGLKCNYDSSKLELVSSSINDSNFIDMGSSGEIALTCNSGQKITSSNIYVFNFKVKENVKADEKIVVSTNSFIVDSDLTTNSEISVSAQSTTITVASSSSGDNTKDNKDTETEKLNTPTNSKTPSTQKKEETPSTQEKNTSINNVKAKSIKQNTSDKSLPKAGIVTGIGILIITLGVVSVICFIRFKTMTR